MRPKLRVPSERPFIEDDDLKERFTDEYRKEISKINTRLSDDEARDFVAELNYDKGKHKKAIDPLVRRSISFMAEVQELGLRELGRKRVGWKRISRPVGSNLLWIADFFCSKKTQRQITDEVIATMKHEIYEALKERRKVKATWIHLRGCGEFFFALSVHRLLKTLFDLWRHAGPRG